MAQVTELRKQGLSPEETAQKIDLTSHKAISLKSRDPAPKFEECGGMYAWMTSGHINQMEAISS